MTPTDPAHRSGPDPDRLRLGRAGPFVDESAEEPVALEAIEQEAGQPVVALARALREMDPVVLERPRDVPLGQCREASLEVAEGGTSLFGDLAHDRDVLLVERYQLIEVLDLAQGEVRRLVSAPVRARSGQQHGRDAVRPGHGDDLA